MSTPATEERSTGEAQPCPRCGKPLSPGQDWCLSCGAPASTRIAPAPGWRVPLAIVAAVALVAAAALAVAFLELSDDAERAAQVPDATPTATATATPPATATPTPTTTPEPTAAPATVEEWPADAEGYTVILLSGSNRGAAEKVARDYAAAGTPAGVLHSDDFSSLRAGYWVVFSGRHETKAEADAALAALAASAPGAYVRLVKP